MADKVFLALYKGRAKNFWHRLADSVVKWASRGKYSHCEIAVQMDDGYQCYSSSYRDGGVRAKCIDVESGNWDLIPLDIDHHRVRLHFWRTMGNGYDFWGAIGSIMGVREHPDKYFCSEWCFNAISGSRDGWRFSPSDLAAIVRKNNG